MDQVTIWFTFRDNFYTFFSDLQTKSETDIYNQLEVFGPKKSCKFEIKENMNELVRRDFYTEMLAWSVPSQNIVVALSSYLHGKTVMSIGCGRGLWEFLLMRQRIHVIPIDIEMPRPLRFLPELNPIYCEFVQMSHTEAIQRYNVDDVLFLNWSPYLSPMAFESLKSKNWLCVIYIGEDKGGCTADDNFHDYLEERYDLVSDSKIPELPHWWSIHDFISVYELKTKFMISDDVDEFIKQYVERFMRNFRFYKN